MRRGPTRGRRRTPHRSRVAHLGTALSLLVAALSALWLGSGCGQGGGEASAGAGGADQAGTRASGGPAPNFTLTNQFGRRTSLRQYRGKAVVLAFVDSKCTTICPLTTTSMLEGVHELGRAGRRVTLLGIDANPEATAVRDVRAYSAAHSMLYRWSFLTGTRPELAHVWKAYHVYVRAIHGNIDHEPVVYVIDPQGRERSVLLTAMAYSSVGVQANQLAKATASALGLDTVPHPSARPPSDVVPRQSVSLRAVAGMGRGSRVVLGRGHPHLFVFIASWLRQTSNLRERLAALDRYARRARQHGWPSPVGVDLGSVERSPGALPRWVARESPSLDYPVVEDRTGGLADGYRVRDAPWFVLTSPHGHIVWTHDGWISSAALQGVLKRAESR